MSWRNRMLGACLATVLPGIALAADPVMPQMPIVPVATIAPAPPPGPASVVTNPSDNTITPEMLQPLKIVMKSGVDQIVPMAVNHINRIVTPFVNPKLHTTATLTLDPKGSVIYVSSAVESTASVYITEGDNESMALELTLVFRKIPPRELTLALPDDVTPPAPRFNTVAASSGGEGGDGGNGQMPYVAGIRESLTAAAHGRVPDGYSMRKLIKSDLAPYCSLPPGLSANWQKAQVMEGGDLQIVIGLLKNDTQGPVEPIENWCGTDDVMAVAFWPRNYLEPGQETEVMIMRHRPHQELRGSIRPSLVRN